MSFTSKVIDPENLKRLEELGRESAFAHEICTILEDGFKSLKYSDVYFHCCQKNIVKLHREDARKKLEAIISKEANNPVVNQCEAWKPDFKYHNCCSNYDLTEDEKTFLWLINGFIDSLGIGLGKLYSTTKVFLGVSNGKIKETGWNDEDDSLGYYTKNSSEYSGPQVWLIMDKITAEAERLCLEREYIIAKVYIHEMMHRSFDLRPDWGQKPYVREIEEPMAEFATLKFIEELSKQRPIFEKLLPIAIVMTEGLRKSEKHFIYALGVDLYYKAPIKLIFDFRRIAMLLHKSSKNDEQLDPLPMKSVDDFVGQCKPDQDLRQLVGDIKKCIEAYAKFFPLNKGIQ